jgi:3'-phosphoadenosine 5'-phosphosulfate sulfotransferase (PAPS reductase)/FAD synthetase
MIDQEQRIEQMIAAGQQIVKDAILSVTESGKKIVARLAAFSGGNDSIVATHFAMSNVPDCIVFNADTMIGLQPARDHIAKCIERYRWPAEIMQATPEGPPSVTENNREIVASWIDGKTAYEERVLNYGFCGKAMHQIMYINLKERPLIRLNRRLKNGVRGGLTMIISGIRHDESSIRAGYKRAWQISGSCLWVNPFYYFTAADFAMYRDEFGLPQNPVKKQCGISGECCCGAFGTGAERQAYRQIDPVFSAYLDTLEQRVMQRFPWGWGQCPPKSWMDSKRGQEFLFDSHEGIQTFQPMCVGCNNGRR